MASVGAADLGAWLAADGTQRRLQMPAVCSSKCLESIVTWPW